MEGSGRGRGYGHRGGRTGRGGGRGGRGGDGGGRGRGGGGPPQYGDEQGHFEGSRGGPPRYGDDQGYFEGGRGGGRGGSFRGGASHPQHFQPQGGRGGGAGRGWQQEQQHHHGGRGAGQGGRGFQDRSYASGSAQASSSSAARGHAYQRSADPIYGSIISNMQSLDISGNVPSVSKPETTGKLVPVKRPDTGGKNLTRTCNILVNHYPVRFNPQTIIMHYDVDIKVMPDQNRKVSKTDLRMIRDKLLSDGRCPMFFTAYDGEKNIFSTEPLPTGSITVDLSEGEDTKKCSFLLTLKLVNQLKLCNLRNYLSGNLPYCPRDVLQGLDLVMKENPTRQMISVGRYFYPKEFHPNDDLGWGIAGYRGFQHSLKPTSQGLALCLDYSVLAFRKPEPVIDFLYEHIPNFRLDDFNRFKHDVENALKGVKVRVSHRRSKQKYIVVRLTDEGARRTTFPVEDPEGLAPPRNVSLLDYFRDKYGKDIKHKDIPCLDLSKNNKKNYVPMEFCTLVEGQRYPKEHLDSDTALLLKKLSLPPANERKNMIQRMVESNDGPRGNGIARHFGMEITMNMTAVRGRVIGPPEIKLGGGMNRMKVNREKCNWNLVGKSVAEGKPLKRWAALDFSASDRGYTRLNPDRFIPALINRCRTLGIQMEEPILYKPAKMSMFSNVAQLHEVLENVNLEAEHRAGGRLQLLLCVMSRRDPGYKHLKLISETKIGLVTQCCLSTEANKTKDQTLANLALKINAKLGGSNSELFDRLPRFRGEDHVMFVGADVNHPSALNTTCPSIAAVVASMNWPAANRYAARVCFQLHRKEKIVNFGEMCADLVDAYARANGVLPTKIVVFRDGVSDGQFDMVLNEELLDLKRAIQAKRCASAITLIVAQKRHQTRLFPRSKDDGSETGNVPPGTVVDTGIVHPFEFDFYLCSHHGSLGTSKPTHYHVLWDENRFSSDELQQLIYNLCFTFARCTKSVSLVPPVYYADLVAYRGRMYQEALLEGQPWASLSFGGVMYKLHGDIENAMFFV